MINLHKIKRLAAVLVLFAVVLQTSMALANAKIGDESDGSRTHGVHVIPLIEAEGEQISPDDEIVFPISTKQTCGKCHTVEKIEKGFHFNALNKEVDPGRPGEPWILIDQATATVLPLSYRAWEGTYNPDEIDFSRWQFAKAFASHSPGPIVEDKDSEVEDFDARWMQSGQIETNCLACHDGEHGRNQSVTALNLGRENFRWAATAGCSFANVTGSAKAMSESFDYRTPEGAVNEPKVWFDKSRFNDEGKMFVDIAREVPTNNCYYCHASIAVENKKVTEKWHNEEDVHIAAGMKCVDCHRNGLEHDIVRGYEGEKSTNPLAAKASCKGCHIGEESGIPEEGRFAAPKPKHKGIPLVHFKELSCTACHSGPWPKDKAEFVKTSRAHKLGTRIARRPAEVLPHIADGVMARAEGGEEAHAKIAPHRVIYPAFWGSMTDDKVKPLIPSEALFYTEDVISLDDEALVSGSWPKVTKEQIAEVLNIMAEDYREEETKAIYVAGGKLYSIGEDDKLAEADHEAAAPYKWATAHNVRPASQSLGIRGCSDCHTTDAAFFFGEVAVDTPVVDSDAVALNTDFQDIDHTKIKIFNFTFVFRPMMKIVCLLSCAVIAIVLLTYVIKGLCAFTKIVGDQEE